MAAVLMSLKPLTDAIDDVEALARYLVLIYTEHGVAGRTELHDAVERLAHALWELQETRGRAAALAAEVGTPPLHVVR